jgi:hypothetical protein
MARQMVKAISNLSEVYVTAEISEPNLKVATPASMIAAGQ